MRSIQTPMRQTQNVRNTGSKQSAKKRNVDAANDELSAKGSLFEIFDLREGGCLFGSEQRKFQNKI